MDTDFLQSHLDRVSRSFAFCIRQLPEPLRLWVGVSYLLCRIVDTIEDSEFESRLNQNQAFDWFDLCLASPPSSQISYVYPSPLWPTEVTEGERQLLQDSSKIFDIFWSMDAQARELVSRLAHSMSLGMRHFRSRSKEEGLKLDNLKEVNQYCFFVAGLVGEMLAGFLSQVDPRFSLSLKSLTKAHHFGLFLQKVNLLKDQLKDQKLGRFLVPSREEVEQSAERDAKEAFDFLTELPMEQVEFRRFCAWSLFMGLESLRKNEKLSRGETENIILSVEESIQDNQKLSELFKNGVQALGWSAWTARVKLAQNQMAQVPAWLTQLYKGRLEPQNLQALGIL